MKTLVFVGCGCYYCCRCCRTHICTRMLKTKIISQALNTKQERSNNTSIVGLSNKPNKKNKTCKFLKISKVNFIQDIRITVGFFRKLGTYKLRPCLNVQSGRDYSHEAVLLNARQLHKSLISLVFVAANHLVARFIVR